VKRYSFIFLLLSQTILWQRCTQPTSPNTGLDQSALCAQDPTRCSSNPNPTDPTNPAGSQKKYTLNISKSGAGKALISIDGGLISCGDLCGASLPQMRLTLIATPDENTDFFGFEGVTCLPTEPYNPLRCEFDLSSDLNVTAKASPRIYLETTISTETPGFGTLSSTTGDFKCSEGTCRQAFKYGDKITLKPQANTDSGSYFFDYQDDCKDSATEECTLTLTENKKVTARFAKYLKLVVTVLGDGNGTIQDSTKTLQYKEQKDVTGKVIARSYEGIYRYDTPLLLTATAATNSDNYFVGFTETSQSSKPETFTEQKPVVMKKDQQLVAKFVPMYNFSLNLSRYGNNGYVDILTDFYGIKKQIQCKQNSCDYKLKQGEVIQLSRIITDPDSFGPDWNGCTNQTFNPKTNNKDCSITISKRESITAEIKKKPFFRVTSKGSEDTICDGGLNISGDPELACTECGQRVIYRNLTQNKTYTFKVTPDQYSFIIPSAALPYGCSYNAAATEINCSITAYGSDSMSIELPILYNRITIQKSTSHHAASVAVKSDFSELEMSTYNGSPYKTSTLIKTGSTIKVWIDKPNNNAAEHKIQLSGTRSDIVWGSSTLIIPNIQGRYNINIESRGRYWHRVEYPGITGKIKDFFKFYDNYYTITDDGLFALEPGSPKWSQVSTDIFLRNGIVYYTSDHLEAVIVGEYSGSLLFQLMGPSRNFYLDYSSLSSKVGHIRIAGVSQHDTSGEFTIFYGESAIGELSECKLAHGNRLSAIAKIKSTARNIPCSNIERGVKKAIWMDGGILIILDYSGTVYSCLYDSASSQYSCTSIVNSDLLIPAGPKTKINNISLGTSGLVLSGFSESSGVKKGKIFTYNASSKLKEIYSFESQEYINNAWIDSTDGLFFAGRNCALSDPYSGELPESCYGLEFKFLNEEYIGYAALSTTGVLYRYY